MYQLKLCARMIVKSKNGVTFWQKKQKRRVKKAGVDPKETYISHIDSLFYRMYLRIMISLPKDHHGETNVL